MNGLINRDDLRAMRALGFRREKRFPADLPDRELVWRIGNDVRLGISTGNAQLTACTPGLDYTTVTVIRETVAEVLGLLPAMRQALQAVIAAETEALLDATGYLQGLEATARDAACDGDHGGPACADAQCWHRDPPEVSHG